MLNTEILKKITSIAESSTVNLAEINKDIELIYSCLNTIENSLILGKTVEISREVKPLTLKEANVTKTFLKKIAKAELTVDDFSYEYENIQSLVWAQGYWNEDRQKHIPYLAVATNNTTRAVLKSNPDEIIIIREGGFLPSSLEPEKNDYWKVELKKKAAPHFNEFLEMILQTLSRK